MVALAVMLAPTLATSFALVLCSSASQLSSSIALHS